MPVYRPHWQTSFRSLSSNHGRISNRALERSSNSNLHEMSPRKLERPFRHVILTLDPNKFAEKKQQRLNPSNLTSFRLHISLLKQSSLVEAPRMEYDVNQKTGTRIRPMYPPDTKAFLYYSVPPGKPRIAGELRLRVTSSDDPASFESGSDLLRTNGRPWMRPLLGLSKNYFPLYEKLKEERIIPNDLDIVLSTLPSKGPLSNYRPSRFLYTLNDTFIVDFSLMSGFFIITEQGVGKLLFDKIFFDGRAKHRDAPYAGSALVRLERSTLPDHKGTRTVVLRILKIITPVNCVIPNYDDFVCCPKEGELHQRNFSQVWSFNIDSYSNFASHTCMRRGLQLLWDT